jgi:hypothetical protein
VGDLLGYAGGAPGVNACIESGNGCTVVVTANRDPPIAEEIAAGPAYQR